MLRARSLIVVALAYGAGVPVTTAQERPRQDALGELSGAFERVASRVQPAVLQISVTAFDLVPRGEGIAVGEQRRTGSGVLLTPDGYAVTNAHVVQGARRVQALLAQRAAPGAPGRSIVRPEGLRRPARVVGIDLETDLAVLKVEGEGFPYLPLADSDSVAPGQFVLAFGSPLGLEQSVSLGVVSAVGRQLEPDAPVVYIQTDASINPGNSGGPLVNAAGGVVGINTMIFSRSGGSEGLGFAVPSNIVRTVLEQIRLTGRVRRGVIGVNAQTITPALAAGLRLAQDWGVVLADVRPRSPADAAGLRPGDVIVRLDGKLMENARQFDVNLYRVPVGGSVQLEVRRGLERFVVTVRVIERDGDPGRFAELVTRDANLVAELGVLALPVDREVAALVPWVRRSGGVLVAAWDAGGAPPEPGLAPGDVIYALNGVAVTTLPELTSALRGVTPGGAVVLHVDRRGQYRFVVLERP